MTLRYFPLLLLTFFIPASLSAFTYIESIDGDLSDSHTAPTVLVISAGNNILEGSLTGGGADRDLFRLDVPAGLEVTSIFLESFVGGGNASYLMMQPGNTLSSPPSSGFSDPVGFAAIGAGTVTAGTDLLPVITLPAIPSLAPFFGASSFTPGSYAGWLNETGPGSSYRLNFVTAAPVPEPGTAGLLLLGAGMLAARRKR